MRFKGISKFLIMLFVTALLLNSCGTFKKVDAKKVPVKGMDRARKNIEEGRGISLKNLGKRGSTNYEFSSSNPMWRASLEILDFLPLVTVDYSGGVIITDWYSDVSNNNDAIKITLRFLSNEIQSNSLKIIVHQKRCSKDLPASCSVNKIDSKIEEELIVSIIKKAALLEKQDKDKKKR
tara:strand:+ start:61 stop:597 length:537 start_codon:yes stop_codon:yes gene_type:complete